MAILIPQSISKGNFFSYMAGGRKQGFLPSTSPIPEASFKRFLDKTAVMPHSPRLPATERKAGNEDAGRHVPINLPAYE
ncbi:MAG: hypothetical protein LUE18_02855 [Akkermansia sp.]|nr:hypothetical protein [Akkermansia sp.]